MTKVIELGGIPTIGDCATSCYKRSHAFSFLEDLADDTQYWLLFWQYNQCNLYLHVMASNTLKDMNSLHVTEKISDCKASLTKPCIGKMNGKSEDRPLPNSASLNPSDPCVLVTEKPDPEKSTVEVEYTESENLDNVDDADAVLKDKSVWSYFQVGHSWTRLQGLDFSL